MLSLLLVGWLVPAHAQELTTHPTWLLEPRFDKVYKNGIGSPAVAYDPAADRWTMFFETQFGPEDPPGGDCRTGRWGIGRATSPDGLTWTIDDDLVIAPQDGTYYGCVVAHPDVIYDGTTWHIWFKAHQTNTACSRPGTPPPWGCSAVTGVGYATSTDGVNFTVTEQPVINLFSFGFPSVVKVDGTLRMLLAYSNASNGIYELWQSVSSDDGATWSTPQFVLGPGFAEWVDDEIYNPALACDPDALAPFGPYVLFAGGRDIEAIAGGPPRIRTAGLGRAFSVDALAWAWDGTEPLIGWDLVPEQGQPADRDWRHWDAVRIGQEYLLFFSQRDDIGRNRIGLAYTYDAVQTSFDEASISNRICGDETIIQPPADTDDSDAVTDTDTVGRDSGFAAPIPPLVVSRAGGEGCRCDGGGRAPWAAAGLLLAGLRARRRR